LSRRYTVEFEAQTLAAASGDVDLFELDAAAEKPIELYGLFLAVTSEVATNVGEDEFARLRVIRGHTGTGNGTTTTPRAVDQGDGAAGFTAKVLGATIASAGTALNLHSDAWNVRAGFQFWWPEKSGPQTAGADLLVVRHMAALADDVTISGTAYILEV
jgi:hypothetical protein